MNREKIIETVNKFFIAVDNKDWKSVKNIFNETVLLDYSSMSGGEPALITSDQIIDSWKGLLPGFNKTHHQLGNFIVDINATTAGVFCYGIAAHYLPNESKSNIWTVVGSYEFELNNAGKNWRISKMKFNLKYQDGNIELPKLALEKAAAVSWEKDYPIP